MENKSNQQEAAGAVGLRSQVLSVQVRPGAHSEVAENRDSADEVLAGSFAQDAAVSNKIPTDEATRTALLMVWRRERWADSLPRALAELAELAAEALEGGSR